MGRYGYEAFVMGSPRHQRGTVPAKDAPDEHFIEIKKFTVFHCRFPLVCQEGQC